MQVVPAVNCQDLECVVDRLRRAEGFLPEGEWIHLDIADGRFTFHKTWNDPETWRRIGKKFSLEVHLMIENPEDALEAWLDAGAKRAIVHYETIFDPLHRVLARNGEEVLGELIRTCDIYGAELMVAVNPETPTEKLVPLAGSVRAFQILAVHPGLSGQNFLTFVLPKVKFLREQFPDARIEVDGGITEETARRAKDAGATQVVSGDYTFRSSDPKATYESLKAI